MYSLLPSLGALFFAVIGILVFIQNRKTPANVIFVVLCLATFLWQTTWAIMYQVDDHDLETQLARIGYLFILFIPTILYHFLTKLAGNDKELDYVTLSYCLSACLAVLLFSSDLIIDGTYDYFWSCYPSAGPLHPVHLIQSLIVVPRGLYIAFNASRTSPTANQNRLQFCLISVAVYCLAAMNYLCGYGVEFYPPGVIFIAIASGIIAYAITQIQLSDITVIFTEKLSRLYALFIISLVYVGGYYIYRNLYPEGNDLISLALGLIFFVTAASAFTKIQQKVQAIPSRIFPKHLNYPEAIDQLQQRLEKVISLNKLFSVLDDFFAINVNIPISAIYICNQRDGKSMVAWNLLHERIEYNNYFDNDHKLRLKRDRTYVVYNTGERVYKPVFDRHPAGAALLCYEQNLLIGIIFVDAAKSGCYSNDNRKLFDYIAHRVAPVLYRALAHNRVLANLEESQKSASLVNLVNEYNHEIKGPLSILHSYATHPTLADDKTLRKLIVNQVDRTSDILDTMLNIAQGKRQRNPQSVNVNTIIKQALKLFPVSVAQIELKLSKSLAAITGDKDDLHILFINLLKNTVEALHKAQASATFDLDSRISIRTSNLSESIKIELSDTGIGIPEDQIEQIWKMGFSKGRSEQGGEGIGLAVVKRIVEEHDGTIRVFNNADKGITFQMVFPSRQPEHREASPVLEQVKRHITPDPDNWPTTGSTPV